MAMANDEDKWQIEDDVRTMIKAEEIKSDPMRMSKAQAMMKDTMDNMEKSMMMDKM